MTRKRFIKLMMAAGKSRNEARLNADQVPWRNENIMEDNSYAAIIRRRFGCENAPESKQLMSYKRQYDMK